MVVALHILRAPIQLLAGTELPRDDLYFGLSGRQLNMARVSAVEVALTVFDAKVGADTKDFEYSGCARIGRH